MLSLLQILSHSSSSSSSSSSFLHDHFLPVFISCSKGTPGKRVSAVSWNASTSMALVSLYTSLGGSMIISSCTSPHTEYGILASRHFSHILRSHILEKSPAPPWMGAL